MAKGKKAGFLKKDPMTDAGKVALKFALRGGSAIAAGAVSNMAKNVIPKFHGPIMLGLGLAAELFIENEQLVAVAQGVAVAGSIKTAQEFVPDGGIKNKMGLGSPNNETIEIDSTPDWDSLADDIDFEEVLKEDEVPTANAEMDDEEMEGLFNDFNEAEEELQGVAQSLI